jgi:sterol desaturase/sphingolipid hydroxylase (fatty acid hydroxylase superfamily)
MPTPLKLPTDPGALAVFAVYGLFSLSQTGVLGLGAQASTGVILVTTFFLFQHANVRTPRWLGFLVQRPESHSLHRARGVHGHNDSDLPVFDLLFGTFRNPAAHAGATGFYDGASARVPEMLLARDISRPAGRRAATA